MSRRPQQSSSSNNSNNASGNLNSTISGLSSTLTERESTVSGGASSSANAASPSRPHRKSPGSSSTNTPPSSTTPRGGDHHNHQKRTPHFVLEPVKLKRAAIISSELVDAKVLKFDSVANSVSIPPASSKVAGVSHQFSDVYVASDAFGACADISTEVNNFFDTGVPLVGSDSVPDADALIVLSAGPEPEGSAKMLLSTVEASARYMAHRSLCCHVTCVAIFGDLEKMLNPPDPNQEQEVPLAAVSPTTTSHGATSASGGGGGVSSVIQDLFPDVRMSDFIEQGGARQSKKFDVSEPCEPFWDRYAAKHAQRLGFCSEDIDDKMTRLRIMTETNISKQYSKAIAFLFTIDAIHFRDGFHRFTSDSHVAVQSQHHSASLFFTRTSVLATHSPQIASTMIGYTSPLNENALSLPWTVMMRHLGVETNHVLFIAACVPDPSSVQEVLQVETVTELDDIDFNSSTFHPHNSDENDDSSTNSDDDDDDNSDDDNNNNNERNEGENKKKRKKKRGNNNNSNLPPSVVAARNQSVSSLKLSFEVAQMLQKAANERAGGRTPLTEHIYPKRTHMKLAEYVSLLKKTHDEGTLDQKTRHSVAKPALQFLVTQVHDPELKEAGHFGSGNFANENREKFVAIFRAAFSKSKGAGGYQQQQQQLQQQQQQSSAAESLKIQQLQSQLQQQQQSQQQQLQLEHSSAAWMESFEKLPEQAKDVLKLRQSNDSLLMLKERLEYDIERLETDNQKLRGDLQYSQSKRMRIEKELTEAQGAALTAETAAQKVRTEANTESLELRQKLVNMQLQIDALERRNDQLTEEMKVSRAEFEQREQAMQEQHELKYGDVKTDFAVALAKQQLLEKCLAEQTEQIHTLEETVVRVEVEKKKLNDQLSESRNLIEQARVDAQKVIERAARARSSEREEYLRLLEVGRVASTDLVTFEDLRVDKVTAHESVYRTGSTGVKSWLTAIGLGQYASVFEAGGFCDILSVANMKDEDLQNLKILAGHRRRILACVADVKAQLNVAISKRQMTPVTAETITFEKLVSQLHDWFRDFHSVVKAEQVEGNAVTAASLSSFAAPSSIAPSSSSVTSATAASN